MSVIGALDALFQAARSGSADAFAAWAEQVHLPLRRSLRPFARAVDVEVVVQETLLRMWVLARDGARVLEGEDASLRFALRVARNVALEEVRRARTGHLLSLETLSASELPAVVPEPAADPGLRQAILACLARLPGRPAAALRERLLGGGDAPDRDLAGRLGMTLNTFLQNVVRARAHLAACLRTRGIAVERWTS
jgi:DNA-directed RNA polymerase specialized sigma24 family protein